jgi:hypothetical protein
LPIRITAAHGNHVDLLTGQVGQLSIPALLHDNYYQFTSAVHLDLWGWVIFALVCCIPLFAVMIFGLPARGEKFA